MPIPKNFVGIHPPKSLILQMNLDRLRRLRAIDFRRSLTQDEFDHVFKTCGALWLHSGDPKDPHAELTSGKCSNGFVNTLAVLRYTNLCELMADQVVRMIQSKIRSMPFEWIIGSDHASAVFSYEVARRLGKQYDFTEKGPDNTQVWKRFSIHPTERVLQVEELVTTTATLKRVRMGVSSGNSTSVNFAPLVFTLVHRSKEYSFDQFPILYVRHYDIETWDPSECPLCAAGSERIKPKADWAKLTGMMK